MKGGAVHSPVEEPFKVGAHLVLAAAAVAPFPQKESLVVAHVGLLRVPGVPLPKLQLGFDPVRAGALVVRLVRMMPPKAPMRASPKHRLAPAVRETVPVATRDRNGLCVAIATG